ncbi:hypothetical protein FNF27_06620 [Cafeteria roenbergensis]|uniref:Uncharacterized protein n=2 Tax=Cafeteria roenbergensis TaxID=33653 RepID=A0A5A8CJ04_CAFRO|nr:hypothetical protein FNF29_03715 [Cafeteria roenbergensis]KAA0166664.1 hypothetical protein FNF28_03038 [Cafeteria roenbergensis]KAA0170363.1 hypothetical protein FNF27_06620 [Cafeteria roenbergensis]|eukprot:KAA0152828.1 hypothetical protein FNF29_03715 [Cafeteria roenbergensis]
MDGPRKGADATEYDASLSRKTAAVRLAAARCTTASGERLLRGIRQRSDAVGKMLQNHHRVLDSLEGVGASAERTEAALRDLSAAVETYAGCG